MVRPGLSSSSSSCSHDDTFGDWSRGPVQPPVFHQRAAHEICLAKRIRYIRCEGSGIVGNGCNCSCFFALFCLQTPRPIATFNSIPLFMHLSILNHQQQSAHRHNTLQHSCPPSGLLSTEVAVGVGLCVLDPSTPSVCRVCGAQKAFSRPSDAKFCDIGVPKVGRTQVATRPLHFRVPKVGRTHTVACPLPHWGAQDGPSTSAGQAHLGPWRKIVPGTADCNNIPT